MLLFQSLLAFDLISMGASSSSHESPAANVEQIHDLYVSHQSWLFRLLYGRLRCKHQAADLAQDTFLRLLQKQDKITFQEAKALLATIAKGLVIDFFRRSALETAYLEVLAALPEEQAPSPECQALLLETLIEVDRMLDGLKPKARQAFLLAQLDGLTYAEIAHQMGVSVASIHKYMAQGYAACHRVVYQDQY